MNSILSIYKANQGALEGKNVSQILAFTGDGKLKDNSETSKDFREFLGEIPSAFLSQFANNCLTASFNDSGLALQDIINQMGVRLSFRVQHGLYRGNQNDIGFDGIWTSKDGHSIILEVKTTDAYRINLDVIANYRSRLIEEGKVDKLKSSILVVVGREDTGDLEAQIRGSRHAWDVRLLSTDSLIKLLTLKEKLNDTRTILKITELLKPKEYTRIDRLIELIFETSQDLQIEQPTDDELTEEIPQKKSRTAAKEKEAPMSFHDACLLILSKKLQLTLDKQSKVAFTNEATSTGVICTVSKSYEIGKHERYWFAFHPHQQEFLHEFKNTYVAYGCGSPENIFLIPFNFFEPLLQNCGTTTNDERMYWHIVIHYRNGKFFLAQPGKGRGEMIDISKFKV
jgi:hypothetical protein